MILIENELVFVSIPKCASISVHNALENSDFKIEPTFNQDKELKIISGKIDSDFNFPVFLNNFENSTKKIKIHPHLTISEIYTYLKNKVDTITIKRDYCKRFISCFYYIFDWWLINLYGLNYKKNSITNDFIYEYFTDNVVNIIKQMLAFKKTHEYDREIKKLLIKPLIKNFCIIDKKNQTIEEIINDDNYINFRIFDSQEAWKSGYKPKHEFDINELYKLEDLLYEKYNKKIKIGKENSISKENSKINVIEDQKLRDWVWNKFEKHHFTKKIF